MELAIETLPMGSCNKIFLGFKTSSWISGLKDLHILPLGRNGESVEITAFEYGAPFVTGMIHGDFGKSLAAAGEVAMREYILDVLVSLFGSNVRHDFNGYQTCVDWDSNPLIRGYVAAAVPGYANSRAVLRNVWLERVRIAGEATSPHFMGDAHGAWLEGKKAVLDLV
jgi:monoamine oxidase